MSPNHPRPFFRHPEWSHSEAWSLFPGLKMHTANPWQISECSETLLSLIVLRTLSETIRDNLGWCYIRGASEMCGSEFQIDKTN